MNVGIGISSGADLMSEGIEGGIDAIAQS